MKTITLALAGNPNSGKTTIYNHLTGARQHVGNYPGVTVEKREGKKIYRDYEFTIIDLPGIYSLTAYSPDEVVARNVLLEEKIDLIVDIADATNVERHFGLTVQLKELGLPMVLGLNMMDLARDQGFTFNFPLLSQLFGMPVLPVIGTKNEGVNELLNAAIDLMEGKEKSAERPVRYQRDIETQIGYIQALMPNIYEKNSLVDRKRKEVVDRWAAVKLLEKDPDVVARVKKSPQSQPVLAQMEKSRRILREQYGEDPELIMVDSRYAFARGAIREAVIFPGEDRATLTEKIDRIILNRVLGLPVFLIAMWLLFQLTFSLGQFPVGWIESGVAFLADVVGRGMPEGLLKSLIVDGIIGGVGGVIVFLPNVLLLFLGITFLEGTGYMARAAFVMDRLMHNMGLHGKSFIPMVLGFGCSIPGIMATRTLENPRDRLVTILVVPLMSCGARLPVYTLLAGAFFSPGNAGNAIFSIYIIGIILAVIMAKVFRTWVLPGPSEPFVMELPVYRLPVWKSVLLQVWERALLYLKKAGTVILAASVLMWVFFTFPVAEQQPHPDPSVQMEESFAGRIGHGIEPLIKPLGFDWKTGVALLAGFAAKEVVVSTMGTLYSIESGDPGDGTGEVPEESYAARVKEQSGFTPLTAYGFMLFVLIYVPCLSTVAVVYRETNGWRWPMFLIGYTMTLAWLVSFLVYQGGSFLGIGR
ncbi:ferrous iron transport protein B [Candidatus Formimonas warabiya]|uniref:Ferrous iron transport protein B n=1 Tax=Formimonas warabiya TaxID=1761012 RepID=A0A3G1KVC0_FORW1|nr:ferrous iron transport protein B [Candidatus Formimonas warabiya]ATW26428.1 ferrous iron transport protein B [Candidatus Formimonas warabiya]